MNALSSYCQVYGQIMARLLLWAGLRGLVQIFDLNGCDRDDAMIFNALYVGGALRLETDEKRYTPDRCLDVRMRICVKHIGSCTECHRDFCVMTIVVCSIRQLWSLWMRCKVSR